MAKKKKRNYLLIGLGGLVALIIVTFISVEITSQPSFCKSCHYMEPYYQSWKASAHENVQCTQCHFPPGLAGTIRGKLEGLVQVVNYVSSSYSRRKPWAEIEDASCLRSGCHNTDTLRSKIVKFKGVPFKHTPHLEQMENGKKLRCTSCHSQIVQGEHIKVSETVCFLCHFKESEFRVKSYIAKMSDCRKCHQFDKMTPEEKAKLKFNHELVTKNKLECKRCHTKVVIGDGFVPKENCYKCHWDFERLGRYDEINQIHKIHIEDHKVECINCHLPIQHRNKKLDVQSELNCNSCHMDMHNEQKALFSGKRIDSVIGIPNPMYSVGLDCSSCHVFHSALTADYDVLKARPESCESCHGKGYARLLKMWEQSSDNKIAQLRKNLSKTNYEISAASKRKRAKAKTYIDNVETILHVLKKGKAIHNVKYSSKLISKANDYLNDALSSINSSVKFKVDTSGANVPSECRNCHTGIEDVTVTHNNKKFEHKKHISQKGVVCYTCHSNERKHGQLKLTDSQCASCHHKEPEKLDCGSCHKVEYEIQSGSFLNLDEPDIMFDAEIVCTDCHLSTSKIEKPAKGFCADCHDEEYNETGREWIKDFETDFAQIDSKLTKVKFHYKKALPKEVKVITKELNDIKFSSAKSLHNHSLIMQALEDISAKLDELLIED